MDNIELQNIWKSYDQKIESMLTINKELAITLTRQKLNKQISRLNGPKWAAIVIGLPYTILLIAVTVIASLAKAYFVAIGFGAIAIIMALLLLNYFHQLYLISQVKNNEEVLSTQEQLLKLRISSFKSLNLAVFQLPFWSICWVSLKALEESPYIYGGVNLLVFALLTYLAYWLYQKMSYKNKNSKVRDFFLSGREWEPILKSAEILEQIKEYEK
jgi:glucan phosphoethanolaminetransferase (alkaline phosphatase superfamily)